uniref:Uncharacterized protein n=1 Tax=Anguilla anguilla TaxID=7936 RepID=A0A0E9TJQ2_ANGAN
MPYCISRFVLVNLNIVLARKLSAQMQDLLYVKH